MEGLLKNRDLPYSHNSRHAVSAQIKALCSRFPTLEPMVRRFTHNDGREAMLAGAKGTIPIVHRGASYNLPIELSLPEKFPSAPPIAFLVPNHEMVISKNCSYVDPNGSVTTPRIASWDGRRSHLGDTVEEMAQLFGREPPLYSKAPSRPPRFAKSAQPESPAPGTSSTAASNPDTTVAARPTTSQADGSQARTFRHCALASIRERLSKRIALVRSEAAAKGDAEELEAEREELEVRRGLLQEELQRAQESRNAMEKLASTAEEASKALSAWLVKNESMAPQDVDVSDAIVPSSDGAEQHIACQADDCAIEDSIRALDKAFRERALGHQEYLSSVQSLARQQFFCRFVLAKRSSLRSS